MFCAISGEPPKTPVVSKKSGLVYEHRLILKYITENGKDPITGEPLMEEDLVEVKANPHTVVPRPPTLSSVPSLLTSLQTEYDAVMLELFTLKKSYDSVRQELAHALYANDGANRVVARLMWERDEARSALANIRESLGQNGAAAGTPVDGGHAGDAEMTDAATTSQGLPKAALSKIEESSKALSSTRKQKLKRKPDGYAQAADVANFAQAESMPSMHGTRPPGVTALDVSSNGAYLLTGGRDKQVLAFDKETGKIAATLKGHTKEITRVAFVCSTLGLEHGSAPVDGLGAPPYAVSGGADNVIRVWKVKDEGKNLYSLLHTINDMQGTVTGLTAHPCGDYFVAASSDGSWAVYDLASGSRLLHVEGGEGQHPIASLDVHPDGVLMAVGTTAGTVVVYDIRTGQVSAAFTSDAAGSSVASLSFSENGYLLASATATMVEIWDLRKLSKSGSIAVEGKGDVSTTVRFDPSAQFLAVVGQDVRIYANKTWALLWTASEGHTAAVTDTRWLWRSGALLTASLDRTVRTFAPPAEGNIPKTA